MVATVLWFRRDLRLADNPALWAAADNRVPVVALFVLDDRVRQFAGANRLAFLYRSLRSLDHRLGGVLVVRSGDPAQVVDQAAAEVGADKVLCAADFGPYGAQRDQAVAARLASHGRSFHRVASPYAVDPGTVVKADGSPYQVFTPFYREWVKHLDPATGPIPDVDWRARPSDGVPRDPAITATLPEASEDAAHDRLTAFLSEGLGGYPSQRDHPGTDGTSYLSPYLKFGLLHPDQILARLDQGHGNDAGQERFRNELAWREFCADVLWHDPGSARQAWRPRMRAFRSGYPIVDAGMRQLSAVGWMHNRVRMITASFLVKDLHLPWERGARHFLAHLVDGDLASNNHGWQWVAGSGTDPAPFFRIFNPVAQGERWDPQGDYVRRFVPELRGVKGSAVHRPWSLAGGPPDGYPPPLVDHAVERQEALARYAEVSARGGRGPR
jgi:deoxyribodipyrimidine photo-lyase